MRNRILIFHPTIAPYRIDFFNDIANRFDCNIYLYYRNLHNQKFDYEKIQEQFRFKPIYMEKLFTIGCRYICKGHISSIFKNKPDIVIVGEYSFGAWCAVLARYFSKTKYKIITICDDSEKIAKECKGARKISRNLLLKKLDGIILCNEKVQVWYQQIYNVKTHVFPIIQQDEKFRKNLICSKTIAEKIVQDNLLKGKKVFLFVGRLSPEKNIPYLVKSFVQLHKNQSDTVLLIIGEDNSIERSSELEIKKSINIFNAESYIKMVGRKQGIELYAYYLVGQALILPSIWEPFGAVTNEALLAGQYVMVSKNAGSSCLVTKYNGEIIDIDKPLINFISLVNKIEPLSGNIELKESKMSYTYNEKMAELINWLENLK